MARYPVPASFQGIHGDCVRYGSPLSSHLGRSLASNDRWLSAHLNGGWGYAVAQNQDEYAWQQADMVSGMVYGPYPHPIAPGMRQLQVLLLAAGNSGVLYPVSLYATDRDGRLVLQDSDIVTATGASQTLGPYSITWPSWDLGWAEWALRVDCPYELLGEVWCFEVLYIQADGTIRLVSGSLPYTYPYRACCQLEEWAEGGEQTVISGVRDITSIRDGGAYQDIGTAPGPVPQLAPVEGGTLMLRAGTVFPLTIEAMYARDVTPVVLEG